MSNPATTSPIQWERTDAPLLPLIPVAFWADPTGLCAAAGKELKRTAHHRDSCALPLADGAGALCVKHFILSTFGERLKWRLGLAAAQKEWRVLRFLHARRCAVPAPLACGWRRGAHGLDVWVVTEYIRDAVTFDQVRPMQGVRDARLAAAALAEVVAGIHAAGVWHGDLHSGNLLYVAATNTWTITDFQSARRGVPGRTEFVNDLVQLQHCLGKKVRLGIRVAFLRRYLAAFAELTGTGEEQSGEEWKSLFVEIRAKSRLYSIRQAQARSRRSERENRDFARLERWIAPLALPPEFEQGWVARHLSRQMIADFLALVQDQHWFLSSEITVLKNTRSVAVGVWAHPHGRLFIKQYRFRHLWRDRLFRLLHKSKAYRAWRRSWRLLHLHVNTPKPILVLWTPNGGFLVSEYIADAVTSEAAFLRAQAEGSLARRRMLIHAAAAELGHLHDRGVEHADLKASNVLVTRVDSSAPEILFTDVDAARFYAHLPLSRRVRDLARLHAAFYPYLTNAERRYFLRVYLKQLTEPVSLRALIVAVEERAAGKIIAKHHLRPRGLSSRRAINNGNQL